MAAIRALRNHTGGRLLGSSGSFPASRSLADALDNESHFTEGGIRHAAYLANRGAPLTVKGTGGRSSVSGVIATVFGATGFLGRYVVQQLARMGSQVIIPYRGIDDVPRHLKPMGDLGQIVNMPCNIRDDDSIRTAISKSNVVINLIGRDYETRNFSFDDVNIDIAERIAKLSHEHGGIARYVHLSCNGANENSPSKLLRSKAIGEEIVRKTFPGATVLRPTIIFGFEDRFLNEMTMMSRKFPNMPIFYGGKTRLQPVYVVDVAAGVVAAVRDQDGAFMGKAYDLGGPNVYTMEELCYIIYEILREKPRVMHFPITLARMMANAREYVFKKIRIPMPTMWPFYKHYLDMLEVDQVVPSDALTFTDLGINPRPLKGLATEYLFYFREGGASMGANRM